MPIAWGSQDATRLRRGIGMLLEFAHLTNLRLRGGEINVDDGVENLRRPPGAEIRAKSNVRDGVESLQGPPGAYMMMMIMLMMM
eukprot:1955142-Pyramimonas_sp.AAC.1